MNKYIYLLKKAALYAVFHLFTLKSTLQVNPPHGCLYSIPHISVVYVSPRTTLPKSTHSP